MSSLWHLKHSDFNFFLYLQNVYQMWIAQIIPIWMNALTRESGKVQIFSKCSKFFQHFSYEIQSQWLHFAAACNFSLQRPMWHSNSWGNYWSAYPSFKRSRLQNWNLKLTNLDGFSNFSNARWLGCIPKLKRTRYKLRDSANVFFNTCQLSKTD